MTNPPPASPADRLASLRRLLAGEGLAGFIVPRADEHLGEYVPAAAERLAWLTGFTGSAGLAAVLADRAAVFTDGRYILQLAAETDPALWERGHSTEQPPPDWLRRHAPAGGTIGYDPMLISEEGLARYAAAGPACARWRRTRSTRCGPTGPPLRPPQRGRIRWPGPAVPRPTSAPILLPCCAPPGRRRR